MITEIQTLSATRNLRIDRNFVFYITSFKKYGSEDEQLIKDLIVYMSYRFQKDLFGFISLDPEDFCKQMKYDKTNLLRTHKNPVFYELKSELSEIEHLELEKKHGKDSKYRVWKNKLENALLILQSERFYFSEDAKENNISEVTLNNFMYIKEISVAHIKTGKTKKLLYKYKPTEEFETKLKNLFIVTSLESYLNLKSKNLTDLYFRLTYNIQHYDKKRINAITYDFKSFAELMNIKIDSIEDENIKNGFSNVKKNINRKFNKDFLPIIKDETLDLKLDWIKGKNAKYNNVPQISWVNKTIEEISAIENKVYGDLFYTELLKTISKNYYQNYKQHVLNNNDILSGFLEWVFSYDDFEIKESIYLSVYANIRGNKTTDINMIKQNATLFFGNLSSIGSWNKKHSFVGYTDNLFFLTNPKTNQTRSIRGIKEFILEVFNSYDLYKHYYSK